MPRRPTLGVLDKSSDLITYTDASGKQRCLGDLMYFAGKGVFDPYWGLLDNVTPEEARRHNEALDAAMLKGLDENCELQQGGTFYLQGGEVRTFIGTVVSADVEFRGADIIFRRNGKEFRGRRQRGLEVFNYRRVK